MVPAPGAVQAKGHNVEATKSEPDKITYLVVDGQHGADPTYDYGTHFLYQGHELGTAAGDYITRINLDADAAHRVTKLAEIEADGKTPVPQIDGSTWDPFAQRMLFTTEGGSSGGVVEATLDYPSKVSNLWGVLGQGGFEGIQNDQYGNVYVVEDIGGSPGTVNGNAQAAEQLHLPAPALRPSDLDKGGKLQVLQLGSIEHHRCPIVFNPGQAEADILSQDVADEHTYGKTFATTWLTIHDTAVSGGTAALRCEHAREGRRRHAVQAARERPVPAGIPVQDVLLRRDRRHDSLTEAGAGHGGFGSVMKLPQQDTAQELRHPAALLPARRRARGLRQRHVLRQDAHDPRPGHGRHAAHADQRARLGVPVRHRRRLRPRSAAGQGPRRGPRPLGDHRLRALCPGAGFQNEGDNEITGIHESNGDPTAAGLLGAATPKPFSHGWRLFFTHQHGDNVTSEIIRSS